MAEEAEQFYDQERGHDWSASSSRSSSVQEFKAIITDEEWDKKLRDLKIRKEDMNKLVMSYLTYEGYVEAAKKFEIESGTQPDVNFVTVIERLDLLKEVEHGNMKEIVEKVNGFDPEILRTDPQLLFRLQQQHLIELVRSGDVEEALMVKFVREELGPLVEENRDLLVDLEQTLAWLVFKDSSSSLVRELLDVSRRQTTACKLKEAMMGRPKLISLPKMLDWVQRKLLKIAIFPKLELLEELLD